MCGRLQGVWSVLVALDVTILGGAMGRSGLMNGRSVGLGKSISLAQLKTTNLKISKKNPRLECYLNVFTISLSSMRSKRLSRVIWK